MSTEENRVNFEYINSKEYKAKFDRISDNKAVNDAIYAQAKAMLTHRSGSYYEDLWIIDSRTGSVVAGTSNSKQENQVSYPKWTEAVVKSNPHVLISIHNHGTNNPPTGSDLVSAGYRKYKFGVVVCHNGEVYSYAPGRKTFSVSFFDKTVDKYKKNGYNEHEAIRNVLNQFKEFYGIEWRRL